MTAKPSRRTLLLTGAALSVSALPIASSLYVAQEASPAETAILKIIRNRDSARQLGEAAQASWPHMRDRETLLSQVLDDLSLDAAAAIETSTAELAKRLSQRIQTDFSVARTVNLDGWILSLAEVRFYALAAFPQPPDRP